MSFLFSAAFASPFARGRFVSLLSAPTAAFLAAAAVGLVNCGPGAPLCFLLPYAALFVTAFDLRGLAFLFSGIFLFASSCHKYLGFFLKIESHPEMGSDLLLCATLSVNDLATVGVQNLSRHVRPRRERHKRAQFPQAVLDDPEGHRNRT